MQHAKPGVDWPEIRRRYQAGETLTAIAEDYGISRTAIRKRGRKEGWYAPGVPVPARNHLGGTNGTSTAQRLANPETHADRQIAIFGKRTDENAAVILHSLEQGMPLYLAAQTAGISKATLDRWRDEDEAFEAQIVAAQARWAERQVTQIDEAGKRGDWKASAHLLSKHPVSREWFGEGKGNSGPAIMVQVNVDRSGGGITTWAPGHEPETITIEASAA